MKRFSLPSSSVSLGVNDDGSTCGPTKYKKMSVQCRDEKINRTFQLFIIHLKLYEMSPTVNNGLRHYIFCFLFCCSLSSYLGFGSPNPRKKKKKKELKLQHKYMAVRAAQGLKYCSAVRRTTCNFRPLPIQSRDMGKS